MRKIYYQNILFLALTFFVFCSAAFSQSDLVQTIYFKSNNFSIDKKYNEALNQIAKQINTDSFRYLKVFGFADKRGSDDYNDLLSEKRAMAVYNYLSARAKIDTTKVYVTWIGKSAEAYDLHFPSAHTQKRAVDIWITFYKKSKN